MEQFIINCVKSVDFIYVKINDESDLLIIYDLFKNNIIKNNHNSMICLYYGFYYEHIIKDYDLMKKYYLMAINYNNVTAMTNLAYYYECTGKNYDSAKKYYLMAVKNNNNNAIDKCLIIYKTTSQETINDAIYFYNMANKLKEKHDAIIKALCYNYTIDNNYMIDYMRSMNISILLSKYGGICVTIKQIFLNYKQIMLLLWIIKIALNIVPKHVKLNMISLLCM